MTQILGVIGGSGIGKIDELAFIKNHEIVTPWGKPSGSILECKFNDLKLFFLQRHGSNHKLSPSAINYRANIDALKQLGVTDILSLSSVGSLRNDLVPGNLVIINQYIDLTKKRESTFFEDGIVVHVSMAKPTDDTLMQIARLSLDSLSIDYTFGVSYICIEGPQFSTLSESKLYKNWGCDVIGMTNMPEAKLCKEASIRYASIGMITDYDCWHPTYENVEVLNVIETIKSNTKKANRLVIDFLSKYSKTKIENNLDAYLSLVTPKNKINKKTIDKLKNIMPQLLK
ncbi:MAG: MTAP family purine nucleoside phosphorylase [Gammaproteobacteria bacterium]|jgi:5'-methylthioadenosine phosphorylase